MAFARLRASATAFAAADDRQPGQPRLPAGRHERQPRGRGVFHYRPDHAFAARDRQQTAEGRARHLALRQRRRRTLDHHRLRRRRRLRRARRYDQCQRQRRQHSGGHGGIQFHQTDAAHRSDQIGICISGGNLHADAQAARLPGSSAESVRRRRIFRDIHLQRRRCAPRGQTGRRGGNFNQRRRSGRSGSAGDGADAALRFGRRSAAVRALTGERRRAAVGAVWTAAQPQRRGCFRRLDVRLQAQRHFLLAAPLSVLADRLQAAAGDATESAFQRRRQPAPFALLSPTWAMRAIRSPTTSPATAVTARGFRCRWNVARLHHSAAESCSIRQKPEVDDDRNRELKPARSRLARQPPARPGVLDSPHPAGSRPARSGDLSFGWRGDDIHGYRRLRHIDRRQAAV